MVTRRNSPSLDPIAALRQVRRAENHEAGRRNGPLGDWRMSEFRRQEANPVTQSHNSESRADENSSHVKDRCAPLLTVRDVAMADFRVVSRASRCDWLLATHF
jgi:hypothetical protein